MVTDCMNDPDTQVDECASGGYLNTSHGLVLRLRRNAQSSPIMYLLIPATNGIVPDATFNLSELKNVQSTTPQGGRTFDNYCKGTGGGVSFGAAGFVIFGGGTANYVANNTLSSHPDRKQGLEFDDKSNGANLCN